MQRFSLFTRPGLPGHFFALAAGALFPLGFAPWFFWPVSLISLAALYFSLHKLPARSALWRGWWYGLGAYGVGVSWVYISIHVHSYTPAPLAVLMTFLFIAFIAWFFAGFAWLFRKLGDQYQIFIFALCFTFFEWLRSWLLTGFPWLYLGDGFIDTPLSGFAPVGGVFLLGFIGCLSAVYLLQCLQNKHFKRAALLVLPWLAGFALQQVHWTTAGQPLQVVAIQGNIDQDQKWQAEQLFPTLETYRKASEANAEADLILWPETAITVLPQQAEEYLDYLNSFAQNSDTTLITGIPYQQGADEPLPGAFHNSILALGNGSGIYHKQKLVPFGEYVPFAHQLRGLLNFFDIPMSEFTPGRSDQALLQARLGDTHFQIAPFICYEIVYPALVAEMSKDAQLMLTISNDAWFGDSIGPLQHFASVRMRAVENGRYLLRGTNTGITALIGPDGKVVDRIAQFKYGVLNSEAALMTGTTPYQYWGNWPVLLLLATGFMFVYLRRRQEK